MSLHRASLLALLTFPLSLGLMSAWAEEGSVSPYIDKLKRQMEEKGQTVEPERTAEHPDPYIQSIRNHLKEPAERASESSQPYIDHLKQEHPKRFQTPSEGSYTEEHRARLAPEEPGGAIEKVAQGKSELKLKRPGEIKASVGFKIGTAVARDFTGPSNLVANKFSNIYGSGWAPDFTFLAEYKPFYSETYGSLGLVGTAGFSFYKANGRFATQLVQPDGVTQFPLESRTKLTFIDIPVSLGLKYQFNWGNYFRPYAQVSPTVIGFSENRNDGISAKKGLSKGVTTAAGVAIMLDWISRSNSWDLYQDYTIKHYYLTVEYSKLTTIASNIDISFSGVLAGVAFDF